MLSRRAAPTEGSVIDMVENPCVSLTAVANTTLQKTRYVLLCLFMTALAYGTPTASAQDIYRAGVCQQNGGPLTCQPATPGKFYALCTSPEPPYTGSVTVRSNTIAELLTTCLNNRNAYYASLGPAGSPYITGEPIVLKPDPAQPPCGTPTLQMIWPNVTNPAGPSIASFSGSCPIVGTVGTITYIANIRFDFKLEVFCPSNWGFQGSFAPDYQSLPGFCSTPNVKNKPPDPWDCPNCGPKQAPVANPIETSVFNKYETATDYVGGSGPMPRKLSRFYSSIGGPATSFGVGWRSEYDKTINEDAVVIGTTRYTTGVIIVQRAAGRLYYYRPDGNGNFVGDADLNSVLKKLTDANGQFSGWTFSTPNDYVETYNANGQLVSVADRYGATTTLNYNANQQLATVTDPFGRSMQFAYSTGKVLNTVSTVTMSSGEVFSYTYDANNLLTSVAYPDGTLRTYLYGEAQFIQGNAPRYDLLTGIVDENNIRYATFNYDGNYRAISSEHAGGVGKYVLSPTATYTTSAVDPLGTTIQRVFTSGSDGARRLISEVQPCGTPGCSGTAATAYTYDANWNTTASVDYQGNKTCYTFDLTRNLETTRVEGLVASADCATALAAVTLAAPARKIATTWHPIFRLPATITEQLGTGSTGGNKVTTNTYDSNGNLIQKQVTTPAGTRTWNWTYDAYGRVLTATDPLGRTTANVYYPNTAAQNASLANSRGMLASTTNALGHTVNITAYNGHGQPLTMVDPNGLSTTMTYDARQRLTSRTVGSETTTYTYDGLGQLVKVTLPDASLLNYTYDAAHRLTQIQDGLGNKMTYILDNMGNRVQENAFDTSGALARTKSRVYDALNRLQQDIGGATPATQITQYAYDNNRNQTGTTDPLSRTTSSFFDALNRLIQVNDPLNGASAPTKYEYDAQDNLTKVTDPKSLATAYNYDGFNQLVTQVSPDTGTTSFTYDNVGNMLSKTDARGVTVIYTYDVLNRVTSIAYPAVGTAAVQTVTYTYDSCSYGVGRLCSFTDRTGSTTYAYDIHGRNTSKSQNVNGVTQSVGYRYNPAGQMDQMTLPSGKKVAVSYVNNRITGLTVDGQPIVKSADYEPFGPIGEWTWGNDSTASPNKHTRYFDLDGRNTKIESGLAGTSAIDPAIIVFDAASRITALQRLTNNAVDAAKSTSYAYDNLDRLTSATPGAGNSAFTQSYTYDPVGNRLSNTVNGSTTTYGYGATKHWLNSLSGGTSTTYSYDNNGNRISDGIQSWIYGGDNRPSVITLSQSSPITIQSGVNALGQRVIKSVNSATQGAVTRFVYDEAGRLIGEYDINGKPIQETIWLNDLPVAVLK